MRYFLPIYFLVVLGLVQVRHNPEEYESRIDSIILKKPESFQALESTFSTYHSDTIVLQYLQLKSRRTNYAEGLSYAHARMGLFFQEINEYRMAHAHLITALKVSDQTQDPDYRIFILTNLAALHKETDSLRTALSYNQDALTIIDSLDTYNPVVLLAKRDAELQMGQIYQSLQRPEEALRYFDDALDSELLMEKPEKLARIDLLMGQVHQKQDSVDAALIQYRKARLAAERIADSNAIHTALLKISGIYLDTNRMDEASELLASIPADFNRNTQLDLLYTLTQGHFHLATGDLASARTVLELSLDKSKDEPKFRAECYYLLSQLEIASGNSDQALAYYSAFHDLEEQLYNQEQARFIQNAVIPSSAENRRSELQILTERNELNELRLRRNQSTFLITGLLFALLTLVLYIIYRQYQLRNERKVVALEQTMLRSQMNPHFLFNSLNSIKHYIINNEQKNAVHYLNKFSKLVRRILEASSARETSLSEELETAALYMGIENIRFSNEIEFKVQLEDDVDSDRIRIPSLILQPFLENALWHGLSSKKGEKKIGIHVQRLNRDMIQIDITDNGVGRAASEKLKESRVLKRKSLGIDITKERLQNFAKDYQHAFAIHIQDLEENGKALGTRIELQIPTS